MARTQPQTRRAHDRRTDPACRRRALPEALPGRAALLRRGAAVAAPRAARGLGAERRRVAGKGARAPGAAPLPGRHPRPRPLRAGPPCRWSGRGVHHIRAVAGLPSRTGRRGPAHQEPSVRWRPGAGGAGRAHAGVGAPRRPLRPEAGSRRWQHRRPPRAHRPSGSGTRRASAPGAGAAAAGGGRGRGAGCAGGTDQVALGLAAGALHFAPACHHVWRHDRPHRLACALHPLHLQGCLAHAVRSVRGRALGHLLHLRRCIRRVLAARTAATGSRKDRVLRPCLNHRGQQTDMGAAQHRGRPAQMRAFASRCPDCLTYLTGTHELELVIHGDRGSTHGWAFVGGEGLGRRVLGIRHDLPCG
mmetsp:Transcript_29689/g.84961  ORF Transcript_29689/g.84961 Transcript_29689/m.84961 type:complete len:360 (+) Transcript_29689:783-1862(+)